MGAPLTGGCQCGQARFVISGPRPAAYVCHCRACQKQSASAFGMSLAVRAADYALTGRTESWKRPTVTGKRARCHFCPECGSRLHHSPAEGGEWLVVKAGALDDPDWLEPSAHIWVSRKQPWVTIAPGVPTHDTQPDDLGAWRAGLEAAR